MGINEEKLDSNNLNEKLLINLISSKVDIINNLTNNVESLLKHCRLQFILMIVLWLFNYPYWAYFIGFSIWVITFFIASHFYTNRKQKIKEYEKYVLKLKEYGILNKNNLHILENFNVKRMRFEK